MDDLVTVFESGDSTRLAVAKATLDAAGIRYVAQGELVQDLFGLGRVTGSYNLITGPARIRVASENAARARELLAPISEP